MKLLSIVFLIVLPCSALSKNLLFKGAGSLTSYAGSVADRGLWTAEQAVEQKFIAHVVLNFSHDGGVEIGNTDGKKLSRFGYKLEFTDGTEEFLALIFHDKDKRTGGLLRLTGDRYPAENLLNVSVTWYAKSQSVEANSDIDESIIIGVGLGRLGPDQPTLSLGIRLDEYLSKLRNPGDEIPDMKLTIDTVGVPSAHNQDAPSHEWNFSAVVDLNTLRYTDNSADEMANLLWGQPK